jgi:hypothetical protein
MIFVIVGAIIAVVGWCAFDAWRLTRIEPNPSVDYRTQYRAMVIASLALDEPKGQRAWKLLDETLESCKVILDKQDASARSNSFDRRDSYDDGSIDFSRLAAVRNIPADCQRELDALHALEEAGVFATLEEFVAMAPGLRPPPEDTSVMMVNDVLTLGPARSAARALAARMNVSALEERDQIVVESLRQCLAIGHTCAAMNYLVGTLVGQSIHSLAFKQLNAILQSHEFSENHLLEMLAAMDRFSLPPFRVSLEGERFMFMDIVQHVFTDNGQGNGYLATDAQPLDQLDLPSTDSKWVNRLIGRFAHASRSETVARYAQFMDASLQELPKPRALRWKEFDPEEFVDRLGSRYGLISMMVPALEKAIEISDRNVLALDAARIQVALAIYKSRTAEYPSSLAELCPLILPNITRDPIHGGELGYIRLDSDPHGRAYLLYSFGLDATDDRGRMDPMDEALAVHERQVTGYDFILNPPREAPPEP